MNEQPSTKPPVKDYWRQKVNNFVVKDIEGVPLGTIKDVCTTPNGQLHLVVLDTTAAAQGRRFLLNTRYISQVDSASKSVWTSLRASQLSQLFEYGILKTGSVKLPEMQSPQTTDLLPATAPDETEHLSNEENSNFADLNSSEDIQEIEVIPLLEERLVVDRSKRKIGEVIVRKEIETRIVEVPVRREKLIVEQISPEHKQLAEIDLGEGFVTGIEQDDIALQDSQYSVVGDFSSPITAARILNAMARHGGSKFLNIRLEVTVKDPQVQKIYQQWFERFAGQ